MKDLTIAVHWRSDLDKYSYSYRWIEYLTAQNVKVLAGDLTHTGIIDFLRDNHADGVMWHWYHVPDDKQSAPKILDAIEANLGIAVFPDYPTRWHYDEKVSQHYLLNALGAPLVKSWVFWDYQPALDFLKTAQFPLVFKLSVGAASANVIKVRSYEEAKFNVDRTFHKVFFPYSLNEFEFHNRWLKPSYWKGAVKRALQSIPFIINNDYPPVPEYYLLQKNYAYFQEFCDKNSHDIRVTVIGDRAWAFTRANRPGDFRASGSGNVNYDLAKIPLEAVKIAFEVTRKMQAQSMAYDFLYNNQGELVINEVTYCFVRFAVHDAPGYWDSELNWHAENLWPEDAQAEDFIHSLHTNH